MLWVVTGLMEKDGARSFAVCMAECLVKLCSGQVGDIHGDHHESLRVGRVGREGEMAPSEWVGVFLVCRCLVLRC